MIAASAAAAAALVLRTLQGAQAIFGLTNNLLPQNPLPTSAPFYPSPWQDSSISTAQWQIALQKAQRFVAQLTLPEKVNLTTGVGYVPFLQYISFGAFTPSSPINSYLEER